MNHDLELSDVDSAAAEIRDLRAAIIEAEYQIADCLKHLAFEKEMLISLLAQSKDTENSESVKAAARAFRLGIKAWKLSITAFENDIGAYQFDIDEILERIPEARGDH